MQIANRRYSETIDASVGELQKLLTLTRNHTGEELQHKLIHVLDNIENLFLIVFMGEFSTGKSSVINAILGEKILEEGITPTTDRITIIKYGEKKESRLEEGVRHITVNNPKLESVHFVDTPGTNVTIEQHEKITKDFIPRADIIFFTIGAERAVTGSESTLIGYLRDEWKKNIVFLLNKTDIAGSTEELNNLIDHTESELRRLFGTEPFIIPVSAKMALEDPGNPRSGFDRLSEYIFETLNDEERLRIKLKSALDLSINIAGQTEKVIEEDLSRISSDIEKLRDFEERLLVIKEDIIANSAQFTERIRGRLLEFKNRGVEFIDDLIRFSNILRIVRKDRVAKEFERKVSLQTISEIEKDLDDMVRWSENSARKMVEESITFHRDSIEDYQAGFRSSFEQNRMKLVETVRSELEAKKKQIDPGTIGGNLVDSARNAIASVLGVQVGSLAVGASIVSAFSSFIIDITGVITTIAVMATAFAILPKKRSTAMKEFSQKVDELTDELVSSLTSQMERDIDNVRLQIIDSFGTLRNFHASQKKKLEKSLAEAGEINSRLKKTREQLTD